MDQITRELVESEQFEKKLYSMGYKLERFEVIKAYRNCNCYNYECTDKYESGHKQSWLIDSEHMKNPHFTTDIRCYHIRAIKFPERPYYTPNLRIVAENLICIHNIPSDVTNVEIIAKKLSELPDLCDTKVTFLSINSYELRELPKLPKFIRHLTLIGCRMESVENLPYFIEKVKLVNCDNLKTVSVPFNTVVQVKNCRYFKKEDVHHEEFRETTDEDF